MGKFIDLMLSNSWGDYQRTQLFKKIGKKLDTMSNEEIDEQIEQLKKLKKKNG